ncbi:hypothetical protein Trydic_g3789 [Trypoxylus dichotomus]
MMLFLLCCLQVILSPFTVESVKRTSALDLVGMLKILQRVKRQDEDENKQYADFLVKVKGAGDKIYTGLVVVRHFIYTDVALADEPQLEVCFYNALPCETVRSDSILVTSVLTLMAVKSKIGYNVPYPKNLTDDIFEKKCVAIGVNHKPVDVKFSTETLGKYKCFVVPEGSEAQTNDIVLESGRVCGMLYKHETGKLVVTNFYQLFIEVDSIPRMPEIYQNVKDMLEQEAKIVSRRSSGSSNQTVSTAPVLKGRIPAMFIFTFLFVDLLSHFLLSLVF